MSEGLVLLLFAAVTLVPIAFMLVSSLKHPNDVFEFPFRWIPRRYHLQNYLQAIAIMVLNILLATMMIPFKTILIPLLMLTIKLRIQDTYPGLILPVMLTAFAGELRIFFSIVLPSVKPAAVTLGILVFRESWDNLIWPLIVTQSERLKTLPLYIIRFLDEKYTNEAALMAVAVLACIPIFVLFFAFSRYFIGEGILSGTKG
jgi:multiple sugar transport system permease protein